MEPLKNETLSSLFMTIGVIIMIQADTFYLGVISALVFGNGLGGMYTQINVLWADYYGRESLGVIRGVHYQYKQADKQSALSLQEFSMISRATILYL